MTIFGYDGNNRPTSIDSPGTAEDVTITWDPTFDCLASQATAGVATSFTYDSAGQLRTRSDVVSAWTYALTAEGSVTYVITVEPFAGRITSIVRQGATP